ncbi:vitamin K epoxide reductase family protein [Candidatus Saccharibacteria bacterium]|nr:vitamin K epoxide reductase family protein [Candidatus Saccharibacteria bacterium]
MVLHNIRTYFSHKDRKLRDNRWIFTSMLVGSILSLFASFVLSTEAIELAKNADAPLSCNINATLNCGAVGVHPSAHMFGFPNSFLGLIAEPIVITVAIAGLAGVRFPRTFMFVAQLFYTLGFIFALVLLSISFFIIQVLCPWCLLVTLTTTMVWFAITRYNIRENNLFLPKKIQNSLLRWIEKDYDKLLMFSTIAVISAAILLKYGDGIFL